MRQAAGSDGPSEERTVFGGDPYLIVGRVEEEAQVELYFVFPDRRVQQLVGELGVVLLVGWLIVVVASGLTGVVLARRMLAPVSRASAAAHSLAEGLLDTRLPVDTKDEFGTLALSFNEMAQALQEKITELSEAREREQRFTANVAHELRTPVAALVSEASLVKEQLDEIPVNVRRPVELLTQDATRLRQLLEDLTEISLFDAGRQQLETEEIEIKALIESLLRRRGWHDTVSLGAEAVVLRTDRRRVERVISNLVSNALTHGKVDVCVRTRSLDDRVQIEVSDKGPGIRVEYLPRIFERFFMADPSRTGSGTGLGLSIVHEYVQLLGGTIEVTSEIDRGATFVVSLPMDAGHGNEMSSQTQRSGESDPPGLSARWIRRKS